MRKVTSMLCVIAMLMAVSCKHAPKEMSRDELFATIDSIEKPLMQPSCKPSTPFRAANWWISMSALPMPSPKTR